MAANVTSFNVTLALDYLDWLDLEQNINTRLSVRLAKRFQELAGQIEIEALHGALFPIWHGDW